MTAMLTFEVPGAPFGKGRHRSFIQKGRVIHVADQKTESYEGQVKWFARQAMGAAGLQEPLDGNALWLYITAFYLAPKSLNKAQQQLVREGRMYCTRKPDWDNVGKIGDALNGLVWRDDALVADGRVIKKLSYEPRLVVSIGILGTP